MHWSKTDKRIATIQTIKAKRALQIMPKRTKASRKKMSIKMKGNKNPLGCKRSDTFKKEKSERMKGNTNGFKKGQKMPPMSDAQKEKLRISHLGEKSYFWKGGISFEPYSTDWTSTLRKSIRERDKYICQICGESQGDIVHNVHHIDYNKKNSNPENLITLCRSCHMRTNNNRDYWLNYFKN